MACRLLGDEPLSKPVVKYRQLDHLEQSSPKSSSKFIYSHSRKCVWKCQEIGGHFMLVSMCWTRCWLSLSIIEKEAPCQSDISVLKFKSLAWGALHAEDVIGTYTFEKDTDIWRCFTEDANRSREDFHFQMQFAFLSSAFVQAVFHALSLHLAKVVSSEFTTSNANRQGGLFRGSAYEYNKYCE